jgi:Rap1a immunity proteins
MRFLTAACAAACLISSAAQAGEIKTGRDLVDACRTYAATDGKQDKNAARAPHPCRDFLNGFFVSLIARQDAHRDAMLQGLPYSSKEACVRMPDMLTYRDMAGRLVIFAGTNAAALDGPAATLAQRTLERDFPCPPTTTPR